MGGRFKTTVRGTVRKCKLLMAARYSENSGQGTERTEGTKGTEGAREVCRSPSFVPNG